MLPTHTQAAVLVDPAKPLRIMTLALPPLRPGQVLVEMAFSGVCGSQLLEARGLRGPDPYLPHVLGHEGSGFVLAVGEGVAKVQPGDGVVLSWIKGEGLDVPSTVYTSEHGAVNAGAVSTFMVHTITCENRVTPLPPGFPMKQAALLGCAVPTGAGILLNTLEAAQGASLAIFGMGGIGASALLGAVSMGMNPIIAVDVQPAKVAKALAWGATHGVDSRLTDPVAAIQSFTQGRGVDFAIEAAGRSETMEAAFKAVRTGGGVCVIAGNPPHGSSLRIDPMDLIRGKAIRGTWGGGCKPDRDVPRFLEMAATGRFPLEVLVSHVMALEEINQALALLEAGQANRILIGFTP